MKKPVITEKNVTEILDKKFIHVYDIEFEPGKHYYAASRKAKDSLVCLQEEHADILPDAVSCFVILEVKDQKPVLLTFHEYRYPTGQFILSIPSGLIDPSDTEYGDAIIAASIREIHEETGIVIKDTDRISVISHLNFNTPGMTDESTALVCAVVHLPDLSELSQAGAEGSEIFDGFTLLTEEDARRILKQGTDDHGSYYPMVTWVAMTYFVTGLWRQ